MHPNELLTRYLINACLFHEFGCQAMDDIAFEILANELLSRWADVTHPHKWFVDHENLKKSSSGEYINFPNIVRSCAARTACQTRGSLLYTRALILGEEEAMRHWRSQETPVTS